MVSKMSEGPMKALKMKALQVARRQAEDKAMEADSFKEYAEKRQEATGGPAGGLALPEGGFPAAAQQDKAVEWRGPSSFGGRAAPKPQLNDATKRVHRSLANSSQALGQAAAGTSIVARSPIRFEVGDLKHRVVDLEKMIETQNKELEKLMAKLDRNASSSPMSARRQKTPKTANRMTLQQQAEAADQAFDALDTDKDGIISRSEWLAVYGNTMGARR